MNQVHTLGSYQFGGKFLEELTNKPSWGISAGRDGFQELLQYGF